MKVEILHRKSKLLVINVHLKDISYDTGLKKTSLLKPQSKLARHHDA